jgi:hypothetical protein
MLEYQARRYRRRSRYVHRYRDRATIGNLFSIEPLLAQLNSAVVGVEAVWIAVGVIPNASPSTDVEASDWILGSISMDRRGSNLRGDLHREDLHQHRNHRAVQLPSSQLSRLAVADRLQRRKSWSTSSACRGWRHVGR